jgi:hypothetical protein
LKEGLVWWAFTSCFSSFLIIAFAVAEYLLYNYKMAAISTAMNQLASSAIMLDTFVERPFVF